MNAVTRESNQRNSTNRTTAVLIVEDEAITAGTIRELLCGAEGSGFSCTVAETLAEALAFLGGKQFDAVLLDLGLPDSSGLDTALSVRLGFPKLPIIVLTGLTDEETAMQALRIDVQEYLLKGQISGGLLTRSIQSAIERKQLADALRESESAARSRFEELQTIYSTAPVGLCLTDTSHRYVSINKRLADINGLPPEKIVGRTFRDVIPGLAGTVERICDQVIRTGEPVENAEIRGKTLEPIPQTERYWLTSHYPVKDPAGSVVAVNTVVQEITDRKRAEEDLQRSKELSDALNRIHDLIHSTLDFDDILDRTVIEAAEALHVDSSSIGLFEDDGIVTKYAHGVLGAAIGRKFSYSNDELAGIVKRSKEVLVANDAAADPRLDPRLAAELNVKSIVAAPLIRRGETIGIIFFSYHAALVPFTEAQVDFARKLAASVSLALENAQLFQAIRESEARFRNLSESGIIGIADFEPDGKVTGANERFLAMTGFSRDDLAAGAIGLDRITPPDAMPQVQQAIEELRQTGRIVPFEKECVRKDGTRFWSLVGGSRPYGRPSGIIFVIDITDRRHAEDALRASERRLELAAQTANEGIWDWDIASGRVVTNRIYKKNFGSPPAGTDFVPWWMERIDPAHRAHVVGEIQALVDGRQDSLSLEYRFRCPDGTWCDVHDRAKVVAYQGRRAARIIGVTLDISDRKRAEEELRLSEERFRAVFADAPVGIIVTDLNGRYLHVNEAFCRITGYSQRELMGGGFDYRTFTHPEDLDQTVRGMKAMLSGELPSFFQEKRYIRRDGTIVWIRLSATVRRTAEGKPSQIVALVENINERRQAEAALRESEARFRTLADNIAQHAWMADEKGWVFWYNRRWYEYTGASEEEMRGWASKNILHPDHVDRVVRSFLGALKKGESLEETFPLRGRDGAYRWFLCRATPIRNRGEKVVRWFGTNTDITDRMRMEEEIKHIAQHDPLTGLPNRRLFNEIINLELAQSRRYGRRVAIFFLDLDRFKEINDTLGHDTGDELLKQTARRLRGVIRTSDTVARIGGDEFNVLIPDINCPEYASEVAQKILNEIRKPFRINSHELTVSTCIGISVFPDDSEEIDTLLRYADIAMYYAKEHGRNMHQFYNPVINTRSLERLRFESSLRQAIEHDEFRLYFQPLVDIATGRIVSAEVLLRWQHPEQGLLEPGRFFHYADEIGFLPEIDEWVLRSASRQVRSWLDQGAAPPGITVNLSSREFESRGMISRISAILRETGLPPGVLAIEIPETAAMGDIETARARLEELIRMGLAVSIDNFGIGYASLNHLKRLPVQKLKIDRSFLQDVATDPNDRAIITALLLMAHSMKMKVVAAGVEALTQFSFLKEVQCDEAQGFFFSKPLPADRFREMMTAGR